MRIWVGFLVLSLWGVCGCIPEPGTGICNGTQPGGYFELTVVNYIDKSYTINLNGREVGQVGQYTPSIPAADSFKEFPTCDAHVLEAVALDNSVVRLCSNADFNVCAGAPTSTCNPSGTALPGCCSLPIRLCSGLVGDQCTAADNQVFTSADLPPLPAPACTCDVTATWTPC